MKAFFSDQFVIPLPAWHTFPMAKYALLRQRVTEEGLVDDDSLFVPAATSDDDLARAHDAEYVRRACAGALTREEIRVLGLPWSPERRAAGEDWRSRSRRPAVMPGTLTIPLRSIFRQFGRPLGSVERSMRPEIRRVTSTGAAPRSARVGGAHHSP